MEGAKDQANEESWTSWRMYLDEDAPKRIKQRTFVAVSAVVMLGISQAVRMESSVSFAAAKSGFNSLRLSLPFLLVAENIRHKRQREDHWNYAAAGGLTGLLVSQGGSVTFVPHYIIARPAIGVVIGELYGRSLGLIHKFRINRAVRDAERELGLPNDNLIVPKWLFNVEPPKDEAYEFARIRCAVLDEEIDVLHRALAKLALQKDAPSLKPRANRASEE